MGSVSAIIFNFLGKWSGTEEWGQEVMWNGIILKFS